MKKKWMAAALLAVVAAAWWLLRPVRIDCGTSELYTQQERQLAADKILEEMQGWDGCRLYSIVYAGDDRCRGEQAYCLGLGAAEGCTEGIVFEVRFRSPIFHAGAWNPNQVYDWSWYLGRPEGGQWQHLTWGAA